MANASTSSELGEAVAAWIGFFLLIVAQFAVRPLVAGRVDVDFALIAVLFAAVRLRPGFSAVVGFLTGLVLDSMSPDGFGRYALLLSLIAFAVSRLRSVFFTGHLGLVGVFVFFGKWLLDAVVLLLSGVSSGMALAAQLLVWTTLSSLVTAAAAIVLLVFFRPIFRLPIA